VRQFRSSGIAHPNQRLGWASKEGRKRGGVDERREISFVGFLVGFFERDFRGCAG
jgi:hypothetical protein